jgi:hypothetical protein
LDPFGVGQSIVVGFEIITSFWAMSYRAPNELTVIFSKQSVWFFRGEYQDEFMHCFSELQVSLLETPHQ